MKFLPRFFALQNNTLNHNLNIVKPEKFRYILTKSLTHNSFSLKTLLVFDEFFVTCASYTLLFFLFKMIFSCTFGLILFNIKIEIIETTIIWIFNAKRNDYIRYNGYIDFISIMLNWIASKEKAKVVKFPLQISYIQAYWVSKQVMFLHIKTVIIMESV